MTIAHAEPNGLTYPPGAVELSVPSRSAATLAAIREWRDAQQVAMEIVAPLVWTDVVPLAHWPMPAGQTLRTFPNPRMKHPQESDEDYRRRVEGAVASAAAVAMRGFKFGFEPPEALESMFNIRGKIGMFTKQRMDIARGAGIEVGDVGQPTEESATCYGIDPVSGERVEITITMERARKSGWVDGNDNYRKNGPDMLWSRAMGRVLDRVAGHILSGVVSVEDARDAAADQAADAVQVTARVSAEDLLKARPKPALEPSVGYAAETIKGALAMAQAKETGAALAPAGDMLAAQASSDGENPEAPQVEAITDAQLRKLGAVMGDLGVTGAGSRERRLALASHVVGRDLASSKDLTKDEARGLIDALEGRGRAILSELEPQADPAEAAREHAADVEQQIAEARAAADERSAQAAADEAQAAEVDPTVDAGWPS